jgi:hypothetical protein
LNCADYGHVSVVSFVRSHWLLLTGVASVGALVTGVMVAFRYDADLSGGEG